MDIDPSKSRHGDLGFTVTGYEQRIFGDDIDAALRHDLVEFPIMYLVLRDLVSGKEIAQEVTHRHMTKARGQLAELRARNRPVKRSPSPEHRE